MNQRNIKERRSKLKKEQLQAQGLLCACDADWKMSNNEESVQVPECRDYFIDCLPICYLGSLKPQGRPSLFKWVLPYYSRPTQDIFPFK